jgi:hypothetical protein
MLVLKSVKVVSNPTTVVAAKVAAKVTPPIVPLFSLVRLSPKYARQEGNPKPIDAPSRIEMAVITSIFEELMRRIDADAQTPSIIHNDNNLFRPIFSPNRFPKNAELATPA